MNIADILTTHAASEQREADRALSEMIDLKGPNRSEGVISLALFASSKMAAVMTLEQLAAAELNALHTLGALATAMVEVPAKMTESNAGRYRAAMARAARDIAAAE